MREPRTARLRTLSAVASADARLARTRDSSLDNSESCWVASTELLPLIRRPAWARYSATLASASFTRLDRSAISGASQSVAAEFDSILALPCTEI